MRPLGGERRICRGLGPCCLLFLAEALAGEFDAVGVMDDAVEDGIGQSWIADDVIPAVEGRLTGDRNKFLD